ncbi:MAG: NAD-dependent epimerase/dehydratase family protein [Candidatus Riflebacteria bacterium]|nr:NAD-dependent epimerase/dehydratase family protein [Candidatus Riflebacteria bacterium]
MTPNHVLLTGAFGFVGSHLARHLVGAGKRVSIVERAGANGAAIADLLGRARGEAPSMAPAVHEAGPGGRAPEALPAGSRRGGVEVFSFRDRPDELFAFMAAARPDVVVHLASLFIAEHKPEEIGPLITTNVQFGTVLLEAMALAGVRRLVNTGTSWEHFHDAAYNPVCLYAATKKAFDDIAEFYAQAHGMRRVTLKLFDTYGPGDRRPKLFKALRQAAARGETLRMSAGEQLIDLVYIDDVVAAFARAIDLVAGTATGPQGTGDAIAGEGPHPPALPVGQSATGPEFGVSAGRRLRLRDLVETFGAVSGKPVPVEWGARPYRKREVMVPWTRFTPLPGWAPQIGLEEGIRRIFQREPWREGE